MRKIAGNKREICLIENKFQKRKECFYIRAKYSTELLLKIHWKFIINELYIWKK